MSENQYVTLVAAGGTPIRLANQTGTPYPTTGSGSLVFANGATLTQPILDNPTITGDLIISTGYYVINILDYATTSAAALLAGTDDVAVAIQSAHDALPSTGGFLYWPTGTGYSWRSAVTLTKPNVCLVGAGMGTTKATVSTSFARSGGAAITCTTSKQSLRDFDIYGPTGDVLSNYNAIKTTNGTSDLLLQNLIVRGCGTAYFLEGLHIGNLNNCSAYDFNVAGLLTGGTASVYSSEIHVFQGVINNSNSTTVASGSASSGSYTIPVADTSAFVVGMGVAMFALPIGTTLVSKTASSITVSQALTANVSSGNYIRFGTFLRGACVHLQNNTFDINFTDCLWAGGDTLVSMTGAPNIPGGLYQVDGVFFNNTNATASTYSGVKITSGRNIHLNDSWFGDTPFGPMVLLNAEDSTAATVSNVSINQTEIGGGGTYGIYMDYASNLLVQDSYVTGNGQIQADTYAAIYCTSHARGHLKVTGYAGAMEINNSQGPSKYGLQLASGSFAGVGDSIFVAAELSGQTAMWLDASTPVPPLKTIQAMLPAVAKAVKNAANQVIGAAAGWTKIVLDAVVTDTQLTYTGVASFASSQWTPPAGRYMISGQLNLSGVANFDVALYKNGVTSLAQLSFAGQSSASISCVVDANGTDTFALYINVPAGATVTAGQNSTFLYGYVT